MQEATLELDIPKVHKSNFTKKSRNYSLCAVEVETVRRAAYDRGLPFDPNKVDYTSSELASYGLVREGYNKEELESHGITPRVVSSLDELTETALRNLPVQTPFGSGIRKYELPINMLPIRMAKTIFEPGSVVKKHVHPPHSLEQPGGGVRIVTSGSVCFMNRTYGPGDWFFVPNGTPYEFSTDSKVPTTVFYSYSFFGAAEGNRFSHPSAV